MAPWNLGKWQVQESGIFYQRDCIPPGPLAFSILLWNADFLAGLPGTTGDLQEREAA
jgi:hypothetical protein